MLKTTCISVRLRGTDIDKIKSIARRLDVSDSEIFRFGIRLAMSRLLPLLDEKACGFRVLPVFVENDAELVRHFDMDATHLERVINAQCAGRRQPRRSGRSQPTHAAWPAIGLPAPAPAGTGRRIGGRTGGLESTCAVISTANTGAASTTSKTTLWTKLTVQQRRNCCISLNLSSTKTINATKYFYHSK